MICYLSVSLFISLCIRAFKVSISSSVNGMSFAKWVGAAMTFFCICLPMSVRLMITVRSSTVQRWRVISPLDSMRFSNGVSVPLSNLHYS